MLAMVAPNSYRMDMSTTNMTSAILNCSRPVAEDDGRTYSCPACGGEDDTTCPCAESEFQAHVERTYPALGQAVAS